MPIPKATVATTIGVAPDKKSSKTCPAVNLFDKPTHFRAQLRKIAFDRYFGYNEFAVYQLGRPVFLLVSLQPQTLTASKHAQNSSLNSRERIIATQQIADVDIASFRWLPGLRSRESSL